MKPLWILLLTTATACGSKASSSTTPPPPPKEDVDAAVATHEPSPEELLASEERAYEAAKPVFESYCAKCHAQGGAKATAKTLEHFEMTSYPLGGHHTETLGPTLRHVLGLDGAKPTMPDDKPGAVQGDELALIAAFLDAWDAADDAGAHVRAGS